jgi:tetratricopeptide (TPR) repeat protein
MRRDILICLGLLVINLIAFWPASHLGFIVLDDPVYVTDNPHVQGGLSWEGVKWAFGNTAQGAYWAPVMWLSHELACQLFGLNPWGHHLINVLLHAINTALVYLVFRRMTGATWRSLMVAALFGLHPLRVESVAWVTERKDVLSGFFFFLTLLAWVRYARGVTSGGWRVTRNDGQNASRVTRHASRFYWLAVFFFALGLMSKAMLVTVPFVLLLLDFWPLGRVTGGGWRVTSNKNSVPQLPVATKPSEGGSTLNSDESRAGSQPSTIWRLVREKIPFFALAGMASVVTFVVQRGAMVPVEALPLGARVGNALISYCRYLGKLFWPVDLAIFYPHPVYWPLAQVLLAGGFLGVISVFVFAQRGRRPYLLMGWLWFLGTLVPVIQLVQSGTQAMADRFTYVPAIGLFMAAAWVIGEIAACSRLWRAGTILAATAVLLACLLDTRYQLRYWRNSITLFSHALDVTRENNSMSYYGLGNALWDTGDLDGAVRNYRAALKITSDLSDASARLGFILLQQNKPAEAEVEFKKVLRVDPSDTKAHKHLGDALAAQGKLAEAEAEYATVLQLNPGNAVIYEALKSDMEKLKTAQALTNLYEALKMQPTPEAHAQIAAIRTAQGEFQDAVEHYQAALRLKPDAPDILNNLAWLLATCPDDHIRNGTQAVQYAERACELTQNQQPMMLGTLAAAYAEAGRFDEAVATAQKACDLAAQQGDALLLQKNQALLELYRAHKPWRE